MKVNKRPIGVFDSGLGGLTVVKELMRALPSEDIIYIGDTARVPYGPRGVETIKVFSEENVKFLIRRKVKLIIIACNTSSAVAATYLKNKFKNIPIFEVISPTAKEAVKDGVRIGVIGTRATVASAAYEKGIKKLSPKAKVFSKACPLLVPFIEEGEVKNPALKLVIKDYLKCLKESKIDTLIMGCTHYPIVKNIIQKEIGKGVNIIDPGTFVVSRVSEYLVKNEMEDKKKVKGKKEFHVTDLTERFTKVAEMFLGEKIQGRLKKVSI